jgi:hypothetical protein
MSLAKTLPAAVLETIVAHLAGLFFTGAAGDMTAAREAAAQMLSAYHPQTEDELRLAANTIGFSFQALGQAATPDMPLTRHSASAAARSASAANPTKPSVQTARRAGIPSKIQPEPAQPEPKIEKALDLIQDTRTVTVAARAQGLTWTQAYEQRQRAARIAAGLKRAEARVAAQANIAARGTISDHRAAAQAV